MTLRLIKNIKLYNFTKYISLILISIIGYTFIMMIKRNIFPSNIVYYEGIIIALAYYTLLFVIFGHKFDIEKCVIGFLICFNFWALIPTIIDRSVSITIIGALRESPKSYIELNENFIEKYVYKNDAVGKRLVEQKSNGNVNTNLKDQYVLTKKGLITAKTIELIGKAFNVNTDFILQ